MRTDAGWQFANTQVIARNLDWKMLRLFFADSWGSVQESGASGRAGLSPGPAGPSVCQGSCGSAALPCAW